jgi:DNA-binding NtrC family response regulator
MDPKNGTLLIADDNPSVLNSLKLFLKNKFREVITIQRHNEIFSHLKESSADVILLDMNFTAGESSGEEGILILDKILQSDPDAVVILITAYGDIELAVKAIRQGAFDFILKPWDNQKLMATLMAGYKLRMSKIRINQLQLSQNALRSEIDRQNTMIRGRSKSIQTVYETIDKVAKTDVNILILGENGTGKELVAREIHRKSGRSCNIFLGVDLSSLNENLFESELFGHKKGSFTDAREDRTGKIELASGGTLFLDEIGDLPVSLQAKLLTSLQNREIFPVGSNQSIPVDIRLICATNKDLNKLIKEHLFREDLYYRINTITIQLPPLRDREDDIIILAEHFLSYFAKRYDKHSLKFNGKAIDALMYHKWPGNIRELKHTIEKAVILSENYFISREDLFFNTSIQTYPELTEPASMEDYERVIISRLLKKHHGNISRAAGELKIGRQSLYRKIKKYDL